MKKKLTLADYLELIGKDFRLKKIARSKYYARIATKKLSSLSGTPAEKHELYLRMGHISRVSGKYSDAIDAFNKAYLTALQYRMSPALVARASYEIGNSFLFVGNAGRALDRFRFCEKYFQQYGDSIPPMDRRMYIGVYTGLAFCCIGNGMIEEAGKIIMEILPSYDPEPKGFGSLNRHHLAGEYYYITGDYDKARRFFTDCISISNGLNFPQGIVEANVHLAVIQLFERNVPDAIKILKETIKLTYNLERKFLYCEAALLLVKCYDMANLPDKASALENRIRPLLNKLDIIWLYDKEKEFEKLRQRLMGKNSTAEPRDKFIPGVLSRSLNNQYENSSCRNMMVGKSGAMLEIYSLIEKIAVTDLSVLIQGETGTGKELIAHAVHNNSARAKNVWLAFNCAALPQALLESELFGYAKGAFTGAVGEKKGYLEIASEGTLFIDEIADMPAAMQQKLLRALEEKQVRRIGSEKPVPVNPRFVFACNRNLEELVKKKLFREDLFYRMNAIVINLPALRERKEDIPALVRHFLQKYSMAGKPMEITDEALNVLCGYSWPGNIRELENEIKKICVLNKDSKTADVRMISESVLSRSNPKGLCSGGGRTLKELREEFERNTILETLKKNDGNITRTARELGYARPSFYDKIKQLGININSLDKTDKSFLR